MNCLKYRHIKNCFETVAVNIILLTYMDFDFMSNLLQYVNEILSNNTMLSMNMNSYYETYYEKRARM